MEKTRRKEKVRYAKVGDGKEKGLQSVNVWQERDVADKFTSVPILSMSFGETAKNRITRPKDDARGVANPDEADEVDVHQNQSRQSKVRVGQQIRPHG